MLSRLAGPSKYVDNGVVPCETAQNGSADRRNVPAHLLLADSAAQAELGPGSRELRGFFEMLNKNSRRLGAHAVAALALAGLLTSTAGQADTPPQLEAIGEAARAPVQAEEERAPEAIEDQAKHIGDGVASYYGAELAGNRTASGERFNPALLTAAHRSLPLGSQLRVTNKANGKSVVVRVNDRGPFHKSRVIDVSLAAARKISMIGAGKAAVRLELMQ